MVRLTHKNPYTMCENIRDYKVISEGFTATIAAPDIDAALYTFYQKFGHAREVKAIGEVVPELNEGGEK